MLIRDIAKAVGYMVSCLPAVPYGGIHYRQIESERIKALKSSLGNYDSYMSLSANAVKEINWLI